MAINGRSRNYTLKDAADLMIAQLGTEKDIPEEEARELFRQETGADPAFLAPFGSKEHTTWRANERAQGLDPDAAIE